MPDKRIIVDSIDVSECEFLWKEKSLKRFCNNGNLNCDCNSNPNCYFKQLKRKEQECEELKEEIDDLKEIIQRHDNDNNALLSEFEDDLVDYYRRYKECLTEIKEIAEKHKATAHCDYLTDMDEILQKINEVIE